MNPTGSCVALGLQARSTESRSTPRTCTSDGSSDTSNSLSESRSSAASGVELYFILYRRL